MHELISAVHYKKLHSLLRRRHQRPQNLPNNPKWLINTTSQNIPEAVQRVLQLGPTFITKPTRYPMEKMITDVEYAIEGAKVSEKGRCEIRQRFTQHLKRILHGSKKEDPHGQLFFIQEDARTTKKFLSENCDLRLLKDDKGHACQKNVVNIARRFPLEARPHMPQWTVT